MQGIAGRIEGSRLAPGQDGPHVTFCRICEPFCGLLADVKDGRVVGVRPDKDNPHSRGHVCVKGTSSHHITHDPDRVLTPLRRPGAPGEFEEVSWDEAMDDIATRLANILRQDGPDAVAHYFGNPTGFNFAAMMSALGFFAHFGVWKAFSAGSQDANSRLTAWHILYGAAMPIMIPDLINADFLLMFGSNPLVSHGSLISNPRIRDDLDAIAARGRVVIVDPRRTESAARYDHVAILPDADVWLLAGMINHLFDSDRVNTPKLAEIAEGVDEMRAALGWITPPIAAAYCGVDEAQIKSLAEAFADNPRAVATGRIGICRGNFPTLTNMLVDVLNIVTGRFGQVGGWVFGDSPVKQDFFLGLDARQTRFGVQPVVLGCLPIFMLADDMLMPGLGQTRAFFLNSGNILLSIPGGQRLEQALSSLDLFVSCDLYMTESNRFAHYILPGLSFLEREDIPVVALGGMSRPFIQYSPPVIVPQGEARGEEDIFNDLGGRLWRKLKDNPGASGHQTEAPFFSATYADFDRQLQAGGWRVDIGAGDVPLSLEMLKEVPNGILLADGLTCLNSREKISHEDGYIRLWDRTLDAESDRLRETPPPEPGALRLISVRSLRSHNSWMHNVDKLVRSQEPSLIINVDDAAERNIAEGDPVRVMTATGSMSVRAVIEPGLVRGAVCYPHGWSHQGGWRRANSAPGANVNALIHPNDGERLSASALLDGIPVEVALDEYGDDHNIEPHAR